MDSSVEQPSGSETATLLSFPVQPRTVSFSRPELMQLLNIYGRYVAQGEWRDYGLEFGRERASFLIFRRSTEQPLYRIEKNPAQARRQGLFAVVAPGGFVLKRGNDLAQVIKVLLKKPQFETV